MSYICCQLIELALLGCITKASTLGKFRELNSPSVNSIHPLCIPRPVQSIQPDQQHSPHPACPPHPVHPTHLARPIHLPHTADPPHSYERGGCCGIMNSVLLAMMNWICFATDDVLPTRRIVFAAENVLRPMLSSSPLFPFIPFIPTLFVCSHHV